MRPSNLTLTINVTASTSTEAHSLFSKVKSALFESLSDFRPTSPCSLTITLTSLSPLLTNCTITYNGDQRLGEVNSSQSNVVFLPVPDDEDEESSDVS